MALRASVSNEALNRAGRNAKASKPPEVRIVESDRVPDLLLPSPQGRSRASTGGYADDLSDILSSMPVQPVANVANAANAPLSSHSQICAN